MLSIRFLRCLAHCYFGFVGLFVNCYFGFVGLFVNCYFGFVGLFVNCYFGFVVGSDSEFGHSSDHYFDYISEFVVVSEFGLIFGLRTLEWSI